MKRAVVWSAVLVSAFALAGCPVYPDDHHGCSHNGDCAPGYACDDMTGACFLPGAGGAGGTSAGCSAPNECQANETCDKSGICQMGSCHVTSVGCVSGYSCEVVEGAWACVASSGSGGAAGAGEFDATGVGGAAYPDSGTSTGDSGTEPATDGGYNADSGSGGAAADGGPAADGSAAVADATADAAMADAPTD